MTEELPMKLLAVQKYSLGGTSVLAVAAESTLDLAESNLLDSSGFSLVRYSPSIPLALVPGPRVSNVTYESCISLVSRPSSFLQRFFSAPQQTISVRGTAITHATVITTTLMSF
ncbi:hypothetical protein EYF80_005941 [Liparis tanakae]|uniref:Uncharacterized protein n=1 Tax=Liparis tanakae TaxID=230148 RepID=A0A4Z2J0B2_9TELE|nr:hypothetical protein EYF80_005941 [Liparis tanakae]